MSAPWTFGESLARCQEASRRQESAEDAMQTAAREAATCEERYRKALAERIVGCHADEGVAWSVAADVARGHPDVARLRRERDIAIGVRDAMTQSSWRRSADRKDAQRFSDWSMRRELAEAGGSTEGLVQFPARRAA